MFQIKRMVTAVSAVALVAANSGAVPHVEHLCEGFAPENDMKIALGSKSDKGLSVEQWTSVLDNFEKVFAPVVAEKGATLKLERNWEDATVNAYASREGKEWTVAMFGGLARHEVVTMDGFLVVACHELGHHIGGAPKKGWFGSWASNEGQSDYFGTLKCFRMMSEAQLLPPQETFVETPELVVNSCAAAHVAPEDQKLCERAAMAALSISTLLNELSGGTVPLDFGTPDPAVVRLTDHSHPKAQCRLDTYFAGALCGVSHHEEVSQTNSFQGTCNVGMGDPVITARSSCWFKEPKLPQASRQ